MLKTRRFEEINTDFSPKSVENSVERVENPYFTLFQNVNKFLRKVINTLRLAGGEKGNRPLDTVLGVAPVGILAGVAVVIHRAVLRYIVI